jgi:nucleotide-binding universal stress UspA family protein
MQKILVALHGYESRGWVDQAVRALPPAAAHIVRILVVLDVPSPPFTSLLPVARRRYSGGAGGMAAPGRDADSASCRLAGAALQPPPEVEHIVVTDGDPGRAIVAHARAWAADLVVVGRDTRRRRDRTLGSAAHQRVVDEAPCAGFLTSGEAPGSLESVQITRRRFARRSPAVMGGA